MTPRPVEYGDRIRGGDTFPSEWGWPAGRAFSEERTNWILANIRAKEPHNVLAAKASRLHAILRVAELERRRR